MAALFYSFTAASTVPTAALNVCEFNNCKIGIHGTYATGLTLVWKVSLDGINWYPAQATREDTAASGTSVSLSVNQSVAYNIDVAGFCWLRIESSTWASPSGQCDVWLGPSTAPIDPTIAATINGIVSVAGGYPHSSNSFSNPVPCGGQTKTTVDTTVVDGDLCAHTLTSARQLVVKQFGSSELDWQYNAIVTTNTQTALKAAGAASVRNYCTSLELQNTSATATTFLLQDGSTTVWSCNLPASMSAPIVVQFPTPKRGTAATAMNFTLGTTGANVHVNAAGFQNF